MKAHGGCGCKGPHIHSHCTREASPTLGCPGETSRYSFYRRLNGPQDPSEHEEFTVHTAKKCGHWTKTNRFRHPRNICESSVLIVVSSREVNRFSVFIMSHQTSIGNDLLHYVTSMQRISYK